MTLLGGENDLPEGWDFDPGAPVWRGSTSVAVDLTLRSQFSYLKGVLNRYPTAALANGWFMELSGGTQFKNGHLVMLNESVWQQSLSCGSISGGAPESKLPVFYW